MAEYWIREFKNNYAGEGNPVYVWEAIDFAYRNKRKMPRWVMSYLGAAAKEILSFCEAARTGETTSKQAERVGKALGFGVKGPGRSDWFQQAALREADEEMFFTVQRVTDPVIEEKQDGKCVFVINQKLDIAYDIVAAERGVDRSTVARACARVLRRWRARATVTSDAELEPVRSMARFVRFRLDCFNEAIKSLDAYRRERAEAGEKQQ